MSNTHTEIRRVGGIEEVIKMLSHPNPSIQKHALIIAGKLCESSEEVCGVSYVDECVWFECVYMCTCIPPIFV